MEFRICPHEKSYHWKWLIVDDEGAAIAGGMETSRESAILTVRYVQAEVADSVIFDTPYLPERWPKSRPRLAFHLYRDAITPIHHEWKMYSAPKQALASNTHGRGDFGIVRWTRDQAMAQIRMIQEHGGTAAVWMCDSSDQRNTGRHLLDTDDMLVLR